MKYNMSKVARLVAMTLVTVMLLTAIALAEGETESIEAPVIEVLQEVVVSEAEEELVEETGKEDADGIDFSALGIEITTTLGDMVAAGQNVHMTARLFGFENVEYTIQWQCCRNQTEGWTNIEGANEESYTYTATAENVEYLWRAVVNF